MSDTQGFEAEAEGVEEKRGIGDNKPPIDPESLIDPSIITPLLSQNYGGLLDRAGELQQGIARWVKAHTLAGGKQPKVVSEEDCGNTLDFLTQLREFKTKETEAARKRVVKPLDDAKKHVQAFFNKDLADVVEAAMRPIEDAYSLYLKEKADRVRLERQRAAYSAREAAGRLAAQVRLTAHLEQHQQEQALAAALEAEEVADNLDRAANASSAELTRVHGDMGSVGGLRDNWKWEVEQFYDLVQAVAAGQQPLNMLIPNGSHIDSLVKPKDGIRKLPGIRIYNDPKGR